LIGAAGLMTPAHAAMYRWKDASGQVHYGDTLPASYQKSGATELSKQGIAVKHTPSEAERKLAAADAAEAARKKSLADEQARLDHALTATYTTVEEIDLARDRALEYHRLAINGAQIRAKVVDANLARWKARAAAISKAGRPIPPTSGEPDCTGRSRKPRLAAHGRAEPAGDDPGARQIRGGQATLQGAGCRLALGRIISASGTMRAVSWTARV
jgi:hypothetical protein